jgi:WD40 repeat protein/serine/threonine protein kinase
VEFIMSDATPSRPSSDRNLLFGILALQMEFVGRDALIAAMNAWVLDKTRSLGDILVEQGALQLGNRALLEPLVAAHLAKYDGDAERSIAALAVPTPLRDELRNLAQGRSEVPSTVEEIRRPNRARRYEILRPHAHGGLGEVFVALDQELHREVALKEIDERHADDPRSRGRFVREAEITGGLEHPGIVPVYGLGRHDDGRPYYAMRFIRGETLKDAIARFHSAPRPAPARGDLEFRQLLSRFVAVCNAVAYAHSRGVIHRDLKPSNVMLGPYGETLVVDWGLAKAVGRDVVGEADGPAEPTLVPVLAEDSSATRTGAALGTPAYMSPEQATGRLDQLGPASDTYSLGATLYVLLTGRAPVEGKDGGEILVRVQRGDWRPPRVIKPGVPRALDAVCCKAMRLDPEQRYASALELATDVERWLADEPVSAWREPWSARSRRWLGRHRTLVASSLVGAGVAVVGLLVGLALLAAAAEGEARARKKAEDKEREAAEQRRKAEDKEKETRRTLYFAQMNLVQREYEENNLAHVRELLEAQVPQSQDAVDLRGFEWRYWNRLAHQEMQTWQVLRGQLLCMAISADGSRIAAGGDDNIVRLWDAAGSGEPLALKGHTGWVNSVAFSRDGKRLASGDMDGIVRVWDAASGQERLTLPAYPAPIRCVAFSPDGRQIASSADLIHVADTADGHELFRLSGHTDMIMSIAFSPDGQFLASGSWDHTVRLWDVATRKLVRTFTGPAQVDCVTFSSDGRRIATGGQDKMVRIWDAASGQAIRTLKGHSDDVMRLAFSPDGRRLVSAGYDRTVRLWDVDNGQELAVFKGHTQALSGVAYDTNHGRLVSSGWDGRLRFWNLASVQRPIVLKGPAGPVSHLAFSPDCGRVVSGARDTVIRVWDLSNGREIATLPGHTGNILGVAFSPDGRRIASASDDHTGRVWDSTGSQPPLVLKGHNKAVWKVVFSPDGERLASASEDGTVRLWDAASGRELRMLTGHTSAVCSVAFSPDGRRVAAGSYDGTVRLWDVADGRELHLLTGHARYVWCVAFSRDGRRLVSGGYDSLVNVWDTDSGRLVFTLKGHKDGVFDLAFSHDGRRLASSGDTTVRLWDTATGEETVTLKGHAAWVHVVIFTPEDHRLISADEKCTMRVWEAKPLGTEKNNK